MDLVPNDEQRIKLYKILSQLWHGVGMHARNWLSNSSVVPNEIPPEDKASEIGLKEGLLPAVENAWRFMAGSGGMPHL